MAKKMIVNAFNNNIETGLRILCILNQNYPKTFDLQTLLYLDYFAVHSGDISDIKSLHAPVPYRTGELLVKRSLIKDAIELFCIRNLISVSYTPSGLEYFASELSSPFIESLQEEYTIELIKRINWLTDNINLEKENLQSLFESKIESVNREFNLGILE